MRRRANPEPYESGKNSAARIAELEAQVADLTYRNEQLNYARVAGQMLAALCIQNGGRVLVSFHALQQINPNTLVTGTRDEATGDVLFSLTPPEEAADGGTAED